MKWNVRRDWSSDKKKTFLKEKKLLRKKKKTFKKGKNELKAQQSIATKVIALKFPEEIKICWSGLQFVFSISVS